MAIDVRAENSTSFSHASQTRLHNPLSITEDSEFPMLNVNVQGLRLFHIIVAKPTQSNTEGIPFDKTCWDAVGTVDQLQRCGAL
jgi:hypothetical protein